MTYTITAHRDAQTMIIVSETVTDDPDLAEIIVAHYTERGYHVTRVNED